MTLRRFARNWVFCDRVPRLRAILGLTALGMCLALGYCSTRPAETIDGTRIESIMAVAERPALFPGLNPEYLPGYGRYLQIDFSAPARLAEAKDGFDRIYPKAGFCPPAPEAQVIALGPYLPDGREFPLISKEIPRDADGRVRYRIFVVPAYPTPGVKYDPGFNRTPYDLATDLRPLCIELESAGFEFERVRTNRIVIPVDILVGALAALK